jgi:hypothetical protein
MNYERAPRDEVLTGVVTQVSSRFKKKTVLTGTISDAVSEGVILAPAGGCEVLLTIQREYPGDQCTLPTPLQMVDTSVTSMIELIRDPAL